MKFSKYEIIPMLAMIALLLAGSEKVDLLRTQPTSTQAVSVGYKMTPTETQIPTRTPEPTMLPTPTRAIGNPTPEQTDDNNPFNGYIWYDEGWVPGMISFDTQYLRMPTVSMGSAVFYAPDVMRANAEYYGLSMDGVVGAVAIPFASEIGHKVWLKRPGLDWEGPFMVADSSRRNDIYGHIMFRDQVVEVDFDTAVRWGMAKYGGHGNEGLNNAERWTMLEGRLNGVLVSKVPPDQFDGTIVDLSTWFLQRATYAKATDNRNQVQNYIPPMTNNVDIGVNNTNSYPMWLINGEWVTFP